MEGTNGIFCSKRNAGKPSEEIEITLFQIAYVDIKRHTLCKDLNSYDPENYDYFENRKANKARHSMLLGKMRPKLLKRQKGICSVCKDYLLNIEDVEVHHVLPRKEGRTDKISNLHLLHKVCHKQVTNSRNEYLKAAWRKEGIIK